MDHLIGELSQFYDASLEEYLDDYIENYEESTTSNSDLGPADRSNVAAFPLEEHAISHGTLGLSISFVRFARFFC